MSSLESQVEQTLAQKQPMSQAYAAVVGKKCGQRSFVDAHAICAAVPLPVNAVYTGASKIIGPLVQLHQCS